MNDLAVQFRALVDALPDAVVVHNAGRFVFLNEAALRLLGYDRADELVGRPVHLIVHPDELAPIQERIRRIVETGQPAEDRDERLLRRDGEMLVARVRAIPVTWEGAPAILAFAQDRTELRAYEERLAMADRLASVGTLAAGIAHDLNNPLAHIVLAIDLALQTARGGPIDGDGAAEIARLLDGALAGAERLRAIVDDLRVFARQPDTPPAPVRVGEPLRAAVDLARGQLRHRCRLVLDLGETSEVRASEGQLAQVFLNVIVNAIQAMPDERPIEDNLIRVWCGAGADGWTRVEIEDNGVGIRPEHFHRVFEPYFTTKPTGVGTGLGLWMVHGVVERLGGAVRLDSTPGRGTKVTIDLPPTA